MRFFSWSWCRALEFYVVLLLQVDSLTSQHDYIEKQLDSLKAASRPKKDELDRLKELKKIILAEEREVNRLTDGSKQLKEKVGWELL